MNYIKRAIPSIWINIYPAIQNQILKMICRTIIQDKIKELAPLLMLINNGKARPR